VHEIKIKFQKTLHFRKMLKNDNNFGDEKYIEHLLFCFDNFRKKILIHQKKIDLKKGI